MILRLKKVIILLGIKITTIRKAKSKMKKITLLKYLLSSAVAFIIDYVLLIFFERILPFASLEIGAFIAWCVSSFVNFALNRSFVFKTTISYRESFIEYYSLAGVVFILKTYVLIEFLTRVTLIPLEYSKPIGEIIFFISNYFIQKLLIFERKKKPIKK